MRPEVGVRGEHWATLGGARARVRPDVQSGALGAGPGAAALPDTGAPLLGRPSGCGLWGPFLSHSQFTACPCLQFQMQKRFKIVSEQCKPERTVKG